MQFSFPFGDSSLSINLPEGLNLRRASPRRMEPLLSARQALRDALAKSTGAPPLEVAARGKKHCLIVTTDHTRQNAYHLWLPELLDQLNKAGLPDSAISIFVGSAMRGPMSADEKRAYFGEEVMRRVQTVDHDPHTSPLIKAGRTDFGTVLEVNEAVYKAEMLVLTGGIRYHNFAGYTGGREGILPGACGMETITSNFRRAVDPDSGRLLPKVRPGLLMHNPYSEDMNQACILVKPSYYFDVVVTPDGQLGWIGAGDYGYVPRLGARFYDEHNRVYLDQPAEVALVGAGRGRSASTLYRAHKTLRQIGDVLAPFSNVVWVADCKDGEGPEQLAEWRGLSLEEIRYKLLRGASLIGLAALVIKEMTTAHRVHLVSNLPAELATQWGFKPHPDIDSALRAALPLNPQSAQWLVCEDASEMLATMREAKEEAA